MEKALSSQVLRGKYGRACGGCLASLSIRLEMETRYLSPLSVIEFICNCFCID